MIEKSKNYLHKLCVEIPSRRVGSAGNCMATDFFARTVSAYGFGTEPPKFSCIDWSQEDARLTVDKTSFDVFVSPYSLSCKARAPLAVLSTTDELEGVAKLGSCGRKALARPQFNLL